MLTITTRDGQRFPLHDCAIINDQGETVAEFRQNGWFVLPAWWAEYKTLVMDDPNVRSLREIRK